MFPWNQSIDVLLKDVPHAPCIAYVAMFAVNVGKLKRMGHVSLSSLWNTCPICAKFPIERYKEKTTCHRSVWWAHHDACIFMLESENMWVCLTSLGTKFQWIVDVHPFPKIADIAIEMLLNVSGCPVCKPSGKAIKPHHGYPLIVGFPHVPHRSPDREESGVAREPPRPCGIGEGS